MTQEKILDKLSKLRAARDGEAKLGNSAAAEAFAGMINRMLLEHELSEIDIPLRGNNEEPIIELLVDLRAHGIKFSKSRIGWQETLAQVVARAHLTKILVTQGTNYITFVGTKSHATVAEYAYGVLVNAADRMSVEARQKYWNENRYKPDFDSGNYRAAWLSGFIQRIAERFDEARRTEVAALGPASTGTALIRLDQQLVRAQDYIKAKAGMRNVREARMSSGISVGREAGRRAADNMAIGRKGINGGGPVKGALKA